jgi:hypothetical protein
MTFPALDVPVAYSGPDGPVSIYALVDPRDMTVRYVGQSADRARRLSGHLSANPTAGNPAKLAWIGELRRAGLAPLMVDLERCAPESSADSEERWISRFGARGQLYNRMPRKAQKHRFPLKSGAGHGLTIWLTEQQLEDVREVAESEMDKPSTWARKAILRAVEATQEKRGNGGRK